MTEVKEGIVQVSNGRNRPQQVKLLLSNDALCLQKEELVFPSVEQNQSSLLAKVRYVTLHRDNKGGLGLSIKGGSEHKLPILVSRIIPGEAAERTGQLFVGDALIKVNDVVVENWRHDEVVTLLKNSGDCIRLVVKHFKPASHFLKGKENEISTDESPQSPTSPHMEKQWKNIISIPLLYAYVTRYIPGTDKLRNHAFEVISVDGTTSGIIHCEDEITLAEWLNAISTNITSLLNQMIQMTNRMLTPAEQIVYMCWSQQRVSPMRHWQTWKPKFICFKGLEIYLFDVPPMQSQDWSRCPTVFKVFEAMFRVIKDSELLDDRQYCCTVQTGTGESLYIGLENRSDLLQLEKAWYRTNNRAIHRLKNKTYGCSWRGRLSGLTLDLTNGFSLYDSENKSFKWSYRFAQLKGSSDDGKTKLRLHFMDDLSKEIEIREIETSNLQALLYCIHSFLSAKLSSVDPGFINNM